MTTAELATRILSQLGFSTAVTMEPSADYRRDKIVEMIDEQKAQWRREFYALLDSLPTVCRDSKFMEEEYTRNMAEQSESN